MILQNCDPEPNARSDFDAWVGSPDAERAIQTDVVTVFPAGRTNLTGDAETVAITSGNPLEVNVTQPS